MNRLSVWLLALLFSSSVYPESICNNACLSGDCRSQVSVQVYANCDRYAGEFQNGRRHGRGEYFFSSGDVYRGQFRSGDRSGKGTYVFATSPDGNEARSLTLDLDERGTGRGDLKAGEKIIPCTIIEGEAVCGSETRFRISEKMEPIAVVLYAGESARIDRRGKALRVSPGDTLLRGDAVRAGSDNVDLQMKDNIALRAKPGTSLSFPRTDGRRVDLADGSLTVKFGPDSGNLTITAPAARVDADDSTLAVHSAPEGTDVKVYELNRGHVTVAPMIPELRDRTDLEIQQDPALAQLREKQRSMAKPLQTNERAKAEKPSQPPAVESFVPNTREKFETRMLVLADRNSVERLSKNPSDPGARAKLQDDYTRKSSAASDSVERDLSDTVLKSEEAVLEKYGIVEYIRLLNRKRVAGSVVAQAADTLIVHAVGGVEKIRTREVDYIEYRHKGEPAPPPEP